MSRTTNTRRVMSCLAAMQDYDDARRAKGETVHEGEVDVFVFHGLFDALTFDDWPAENMRRFIAAAIENAPADVLARWSKLSTKWLANHHESERENAEQEARGAA